MFYLGKNVIAYNTVYSFVHIVIKLYLIRKYKFGILLNPITATMP